MWKLGLRPRNSQKRDFPCNVLANQARHGRGQLSMMCRVSVYSTMPGQSCRRVLKQASPRAAVATRSWTMSLVVNQDNDFNSDNSDNYAHDNEG